jgi:peptidoglycan hydrolase-like protein with peptidoglycan-binding domain
MEGAAVSEIQTKLKQLGYFNCEVTGYFGSITEDAVRNFQKDQGIQVDGIVGPETMRYLNNATRVTTSRGSSSGRSSAIPWYGEAENIFSIGTIAIITDIATGKSFKAQRTYGYNHSDTEPLTLEDTNVLKEIYGGSWSWDRRAIIVQIDDYKIAASMAGMPHAGRDDKPTNALVSNRSGGYGYGTNLDTINGNGMDGHFDIHFYNSRTHGTNKVDANHQAKIQEAARALD